MKNSYIKIYMNQNNEFRTYASIRLFGMQFENVKTGNILIGMDVISTWDTHIGTLSTGETLLLACSKERLNFEYYNELEKFFELKPSVIYP